MSTRPETYHGSTDKVGLRTIHIGFSASNILTARQKNLTKGHHMTIVTVTGTSDSQYETRITNGRHTLTADEPVPLGTDLGPNPYEFLLSALGACTSITLFMYAGRKKWPLERVHIELTHDRVHADDCEQCEDESGLVDVIQRKIRFEGPLDDEQRKQLAYIATRCPVHKTLTTPTVIVDEIE